MAVILRSFLIPPNLSSYRSGRGANNADFSPLLYAPKANLTPCASTNWPIHQP